MKVTHFGIDGLPQALGGAFYGITSLNSNVTTTDGGLSAINFVQRITANGSNILLNPSVNFAAGSNVILSASSNTITIDATGGGGSGTFTTQDEGGVLSTGVTTLNFTGAGVSASGAGATTTVNVSGGGGTGASAIGFLYAATITR